MRFVRLGVFAGLTAGFGFIACGGVSSDSVFTDGGATSLDAASGAEGDGSSAGDGSSTTDGATSGDGAVSGDAGGTEGGAPKDAGKKDAAPFDAGVKKDGGGVCTVNCHSDLECVQTCPDPPQGSSSCCDFTTGFCYASLGGICPH